LIDDFIKAFTPLSRGKLQKLQKSATPEEPKPWKSLLEPVLAANNSLEDRSHNCGMSYQENMKKNSRFSEMNML
jgi:hypothetical protein